MFLFCGGIRESQKEKGSQRRLLQNWEVLLDWLFSYVPSYILSVRVKRQYFLNFVDDGPNEQCTLFRLVYSHDIICHTRRSHRTNMALFTKRQTMYVTLPPPYTDYLLTSYMPRVGYAFFSHPSIPYISK